MSQFIDVTSVPDHAFEQGMEAMYKAIGDGGDDGAWRPHESPFVRELIERFTSRGLLQIHGVQTELDEWIKGDHFRPGVEVPATFAGGILKWTPDELRLAKLYLESMPPAQFGIDDWSLLVDYIAQRYLPPEFARTAAEWMATKSTIMGKVQEAKPDLEAAAVAVLLPAVPETVSSADAMFGLNRSERAIMEFGHARCAENITGLTDGLRHRIKRVILAHQEAEFIGDSAATSSSLQTQLLDEFGPLNRDWRRIAMTEAAENSNQGFIAALDPGTMVRRQERYQGACAFCRKIDGNEFKVVDPAQKIKDPETQVWVGKTNIGRSASPMKRVNGVLMPRNAAELWWPAAGVQHPHCRGIWIIIKQREKAGDAKFSAWLDDKLKAPERKKDD